MKNDKKGKRKDEELKKPLMINITDKELDRDIANLSLPQEPLFVEGGIDALDFYSDESKARLKKLLGV